MAGKSILFVLASALLVQMALGHTLMTKITINGVDQTSCLRKVYDNSIGYLTGIYDSFPLMALSPAYAVNGILSQNYTCGFMPFAGRPSASKCPITAGSQISFTYAHAPCCGEDAVLDRFIARSHRGPIMAYLAKSETGAGNVWFKIFEEGIIGRTTNNRNIWSSPDRLLQNNGSITITIPADIAPGNYLLRTELIALHDGPNNSGAQPYVRCAELTISGSGTVNPPGVAIPGNITLTDPGIKYNLYAENPTYIVPGPAVYRSTVVPDSSSSTGDAPIPCEKSTDCPSGVCTIEGVCFSSAIRISVGLLSVLLLALIL